MATNGNTTGTVYAARPPVVSREEWQKARDALMVKEKAHTCAKDALSAERRCLPMVRIDTEYVFDGPDGEVSLLDLFEGRRQLIVQHFMFHPDWENGCPSCTHGVDNIGTIASLHGTDTTFALVGRAPLEKLLAYQERRGWDFPWYSSGGSTFNRDFGVTVEEDMEIPGMSVFLRDDDGNVYQTYATGSRGSEPLMPVFGFLDMTPYGRQQDWEDSPAGWPQKPTYG
ncbi:MAG: DUF899 domain-containing protein [Chloroflexota bacterium]|nr:DUF899 domain-containing protein [Chloroflexota bacterium]